MKKTLAMMLCAVCAFGIFTGCKDYDKMAEVYMSSQNLTAEDVLDVEDGGERFLLHFEGIESKKYSGRKIAKYNYKTQEVEKISTVRVGDSEIDLTKIKDWGCSKANETLYLIASVGNEKCLFSISPYTLNAKDVCYAKNIEIIGDVILALSGNNVSFYEWSGKALDTKSYTGTIGKTSVVMDLAIDGGKIYGYYYNKGSKVKKNFRGILKGVNMEMSVFNSKGKEIETIKLTHTGDALTGNCHDIAKWKDNAVQLTYKN